MFDSIFLIVYNLFTIMFCMLFLYSRVLTCNLIYGFSIIIFSFPLIFGFYYNDVNQTYDSVNFETPILIIIPLFISFLFSLFEVYKYRIFKFSINLQLKNYFITLVSCCMLLFLFIILKNFQFNLSKSEIYKGSFYLLFINTSFSLLGYLLAVSKNYKLSIFFFVIAIVFVLLTKSRSSIVFYVISFMFTWYNMTLKKSHMKKILLVIPALTFFFFIVIFNHFIGSIIIGDPNNVLQRLTSTEFYLDALFRCQASLHILICDTVIEKIRPCHLMSSYTVD